MISTTLFTVVFVAGGVVAQPKCNKPDLGVANYNCPGGVMQPSASVPTSAHSVRMADIKVVSALGDSLTAANGADACDPFQVILQYRGLAFQIGGDKGLENHVTIPNVLKKFNPTVFGASTGIGPVNYWEVAQLNAGVPGAESKDLLGQAQDLVHKMNVHPQVDVQNDWKLVNIFIGGNDMCAYCKDSLNGRNGSHSAWHYKYNIGRAVQLLYDHLPRTIVSITGMFHLEMLRSVDKNQFFCDELHLFECGCEEHFNWTNAEVAAACEAYQRSQMELQTDGTFDRRDDFTLVVQPFLRNVVTPPLKPNGHVNLGFFAPDCFHFSQYGHSMAAKALWNNIVQPVGGKDLITNLSNPNIPLACPDPSCPFFRTTKNSRNCAQYMTPAQGSTLADRNSHEMKVPNKDDERSTKKGDGKGLSTTTVLIGCAVGFVALAALATLLIRTKRRRQQRKDEQELVTMDTIDDTVERY